MYRDKMLNAAILKASAVVFLIPGHERNQVFISDVQWMRGMIPQHSSAIMTSEQANLRDAGVKELSREIIAAQKREIAEMQNV